jgi:hypothetical protein
MWLTPFASERSLTSHDVHFMWLTPFASERNLISHDVQFMKGGLADSSVDCVRSGFETRALYDFTETGCARRLAAITDRILRHYTRTA